MLVVVLVAMLMLVWMSVLMEVRVKVRVIALVAVKMSNNRAEVGSPVYCVGAGFRASTFLTHITKSPLMLIPIHFHDATDRKFDDNSDIRTTHLPI